MTLQVRDLASYKNGAVRIQYDDSTVNLWATAVIVTTEDIGGKWHADIADTVSGNTASADLSSGTTPLPLNRISLAKLAGWVAAAANVDQSGLGTRLTYSLRYPA